MNPTTGDPAFSPPIFPAELAAPPRRVVWPIVLGVIGIVFGALGVFQALSGMVLPFILPMLEQVGRQMGPGSNAPNPFTAMRDYVGWLMAAYLLLGVSAAALITASIALLRRRAWAATLLRIWGAFTILMAIGFGVLMAFFESAMLSAAFKAAAAAQQRPGGASPPPGPPPELGMIMGTIMGVIIAFILSLLPIFMLIWFALPGVRAEIAQWRRES